MSPPTQKIKDEKLTVSYSELRGCITVLTIHIITDMASLDICNNESPMHLKDCCIAAHRQDLPYLGSVHGTTDDMHVRSIRT